MHGEPLVLAPLPEPRLIGLALPMELLWEVAQLPLYDVWHTSAWGYHFISLSLAPPWPV